MWLPLHILVSICRTGEHQSVLTSLAIWVEKWANSNVDHPNERLGYWLGIYAFIAVMATSTLVTSCW